MHNSDQHEQKIVRYFGSRFSRKLPKETVGSDDLDPSTNGEKYEELPHNDGIHSSHFLRRTA